MTLPLLMTGGSLAGHLRVPKEAGNQQCPWLILVFPAPDKTKSQSPHWNTPIELA